MDSSNALDSTFAASSVPHKRPTARTWYSLLRGISFLLLLACLSLAIVAFVQPYRSSPSCFDTRGVCDAGYYSYSYDSFPPIWQTVTVQNLHLFYFDSKSLTASRFAWPCPSSAMNFSAPSSVTKFSYARISLWDSSSLPMSSCFCHLLAP